MPMDPSDAILLLKRYSSDDLLSQDCPVWLTVCLQSPTCFNPCQSKIPPKKMLVSGNCSACTESVYDPDRTQSWHFHIATSLGLELLLEKARWESWRPWNRPSRRITSLLQNCFWKNTHTKLHVVLLNFYWVYAGLKGGQVVFRRWVGLATLLHRRWLS